MSDATTNLTGRTVMSVDKVSMGAKRVYALVAVVAKPLDVLNAKEFAYKYHIPETEILWICPEKHSESASRTRAFLEKKNLDQVIHLPFSGFANSHPVSRFLARGGRMFRLFLMLLFAPLFALRWWWLYAHGKKVFDKKIQTTYFGCDPTANKLLWYLFFQSEQLVFFDGGRSTITWGRDQLFASSGGRALLHDAMTRRSFMFPAVLKRTIYRKTKKNPIFFSCYDSIEGANFSPVINQYRWLHNKYSSVSKIGRYVLVIGSPGVRPYAISDLSALIKRKVLGEDVGEGDYSIRYRAHPREVISDFERHSMLDQDISLMPHQYGLEFDLLEVDEFPSFIVGWGSSALDVFRYALPEQVVFIDLYEPKSNE